MKSRPVDKAAFIRAYKAATCCADVAKALHINIRRVYHVAWRLRNLGADLPKLAHPKGTNRGPTKPWTKERHAACAERRRLREAEYKRIAGEK
jgi:hypothetical protein